MGLCTKWSGNKRIPTRGRNTNSKPQSIRLRCQRGRRGRTATAVLHRIPPRPRSPVHCGHDRRQLRFQLLCHRDKNAFRLLRRQTLSARIQDIQRRAAPRRQHWNSRHVHRHHRRRPLPTHYSHPARHREQRLHPLHLRRAFQPSLPGLHRPRTRDLMASPRLYRPAADRHSHSRRIPSRMHRDRRSPQDHQFSLFPDYIARHQRTAYRLHHQSQWPRDHRAFDIHTERAISGTGVGRMRRILPLLGTHRPGRHYTRPHTDAGTPQGISVRDASQIHRIRRPCQVRDTHQERTERLTHRRLPGTRRASGRA